VEILNKFGVSHFFEMSSMEKTSHHLSTYKNVGVSKIICEARRPKAKGNTRWRPSGMKWKRPK